MATLIQIGETGQGTVGASALTAGMLVCFGTDGLLRACAAGDKPDGVVQDGFAAGVTATYYKTRGNILYVQTSGTVVTGDIIKCSTAGVVIADTSSGSTALSVNSVGKLISDPDSDTMALAVLW